MNSHPLTPSPSPKAGEGSKQPHTSAPFPQREEGTDLSPPLPPWERGPGGEGLVTPLAQIGPTVPRLPSAHRRGSD